MDRSEHVLMDKNGEKRYVRGKLLGSGGFAKCFEARCLAEGGIYALKVIPKKEINEKRKRYKLMLEIKLHRSLKHQNIVGFKDVFEDSENVYIVLEYCRNNTLKELTKRRKRITEYEARVYMLQMVKALQYIHRNSIVHRDLKLGNILVNENMQLKLCDFGLSTKITYQGEKKRTVCGTPNYIAPEILEEEGHSYESDIWSMGVILYALLFGKPPFQCDTVEETYENIRNNKYKIPDMGVSEQAKDLIRRILLTDPAKRLTLQEIKKHPYMGKIQEIPRSLPVYTLAIPPHNIETEQKAADKSIKIKTQNDQSEEQIGVGQSIPLVYAVETLMCKEDLGYLLSDATMCVMFQDRSELSQTYEKGTITYIEKDNDKLFQSRTIEPQKVPQPLHEKYEKFINFCTFFRMKYKDKKLKAMSQKHQQLIYIRKIIKMSDQLLIRLSNGCVQINFKDLTHLLMNRNDDVCLYYVDRNRHESTIQYDSIEGIKDVTLKKKLKKFSSILAEIWKQANHQ